MNLDFESDAYARHHHDLSRDVRRLLQRFATGYAALTRRQFDAPWKRPAAAPVALRGR